MNIDVAEMRGALQKRAAAPVENGPGFALGRGALHEFYAEEQRDGVSLSGFALMQGRGAGEGSGKTLWVRHTALDRETGRPHPVGLSELGLDPAGFLLVGVRDVAAALQAGLEGVRCAALGGVLIELWGEAEAYDLTASRRLLLACRDSGVTVLIARIAARPRASAAETRWLVRALSSRALAARAPGPPAFELALLRARNGQEGLRYHVEWDRDARRFVSCAFGAGERSAPRALPAGRAPLSGAVVPLSFDRQDVPAEAILARRGTG